MANLDNFFVALCQRMGWEPTTWRIGVLTKMAQMEGNIDHLQEMWNPLSTTHPAGKSGNWNSVGVGIYPNLAAGVEATAKTLQEPQYAGLVATMQAQSPQAGVEQGLMTWGWQEGGGLSQAGQQILGAMGGTATQTTQGAGEGVAMAGTTTGQVPPQLQTIFDEINKLLTSEDPQDKLNGWYAIGTLTPEAKGMFFGTTSADTGTATTTTTTPSAQETAIGQFDMETALNAAVLDWNKFGADVATQNFVNKLNAAQEGRLEATAAQEYAMNLAPPGMTEYKIPGWKEGIPLGAPVPNTYSGMMELMLQGLPQAPEIPMPQQPTMPQVPNLAALPSQQTSYQVQAPMGGGLPTGTGAGNASASSHIQAIRNYIQRMGGMLGSAATGGNLPVGG